MTTCPMTVDANPPRLQHWLRQLSLIALGEPPGTLSDVAEVLGNATGSRGLVLWESARAPGTSGELSALATWLHPSVPDPHPAPVVPDAITREAALRRTLALPHPKAGTLLGLPVDGALPVDYADGSSGVLTLCGTGDLSDRAFDAAAELLTMLPEVLTAMHERRALALVNAADFILHEADTESGSQPLPRERLHDYFRQVCARVSDALHGAAVSLYLRECERDGCYAYVAGWPAAAIPARTAPIPVTHAVEALDPGRPRIDELLTSGTHVWGVVRCESAPSPRAYLTRADLSVLRPLAAQLARYWANWLNRRAIFEENASWRHLANGITEFDKILTEALRKGGAMADPQQLSEVAAAALRVAGNVVPASSGTAVYIAPCCSNADRPSLDVASAIGGHGVSEAGRVQAEDAYRSCTPRTVREAVPDADESGAADPMGSRWIIGMPIRVGQQTYGAMAAEGPGGEPPANSAQVYEILSDQLGLYRHLAHTMETLKSVQHELKANLTRQAEIMEDLKHQLVSPLRAATDRTDGVLRLGRFDRGTRHELEAARGLCRKASRVAMSAGVFAALSKGELPSPRPEFLGAGDLQRMLIAAADDCQTLSDPELGRRFTVDRESLDTLGRRLVRADSSFLQQCVGNLLDNADKYSYPQTEVQLFAAVAGQRLALGVASTGIPLRPDDRRRCLDRNWRGPEARNATGEGSGIGLWIVDHLMRSMSGHVELEPVGDALTVALILPTT